MRSFALLTILSFLALSINDARAETLQEALALAYQTSPALGAAQAAQRAIAEEVPQALSNWRPTITGQADISTTTVDVEKPLDNYSLTPRSVGGTLTQPIYRGGRTLAETKQAKARVLQGQALLLDAEQSLLLAAATAYYDVVRDQSVAELSRNNEQVLKKQLEASKSRFEVGEITRTDVSQAESRLARATADRVLKEGDLQASRATYKRLISQSPSDLKPELPEMKAPKSLNELLPLAENNNPSVMAARAAVEAAKAGVRLEQGILYPQVSLNVTGGRAWDQTLASGQVDSSAITAQMIIPIYNPSTYARVRQAKQLQGQRRLETDEAVLVARESAVRAWETLVAAKEAIISREAQVKASELALEGVQREAEVGSRTTLDVLDAEQELLDAKVETVRAKRDAAVASFNTLVSAGLMNAEHLGLPVKLYDANAYYESVKGKGLGFGDKVE